MAKGTAVEPIARDAIPEDLSTLTWPVLKSTAASHGVNGRQKRAAMEEALQVALGRVKAPAVTDPVGETGEAGTPGIVEDSTLPGILDTPPGPDIKYDKGMVGPAGTSEPPAPPVDIESIVAEAQPESESTPTPKVDVSRLPDVSAGEEPPVDALPPAPVAPEPAPAPAPGPVAPRPPTTGYVSSEPTWKDTEELGILPPATGEEFPEPPLVYYSTSAKLRIQIAPRGEPRFDADRIFHEAKPGRSLQFGPAGDNLLFQFRATKRWEVKAMEQSKKFKTGVVWRARDEVKKEIAKAEHNLTMLKAQAGGASRETMAALMAQQPQIIQGSRSTRNEPSPPGTPEDLLASGPFVGVQALANDPGRAGMAYRDGLRIAKARGEI